MSNDSEKVPGNATAEKWFVASLGLLLMLAGIVGNPFWVGPYLSYHGSLKFSDTAILLLIDTVLISGGGYITWRRSQIRVKKYMFPLLLGLCIFLVLAEVGAYALDKVHGGDFTQDMQRADRDLVPFRMFGPNWYAEEGGVQYIVGRYGERYPFRKAPGTFRVVALGGSTTQDKVGDEHYPLILERMLKAQYPGRKIEVINTGESSYATPHLIILLSLDVLSWNPDLIIASENFNDLLAAYFPGFKVDYSNKYGLKQFMPQQQITQQLLGWSHLYWIVRSRLQVMWYRFYTRDGDPYIRASYGMEAPPEAAAVFRRNWETFVAIARSRGIPVILGSQPLEPSEEYWDKHMRFKPYNNVARYPLHAEFISHHAQYNHIIESVAEKTGVYFIDNNALLGTDPSLFVDFLHYTKPGLHALAKNYYDFILAHKLIQ